MKIHWNSLQKLLRGRHLTPKNMNSSIEIRLAYACGIAISISNIVFAAWHVLICRWLSQNEWTSTHSFIWWNDCLRFVGLLWRNVCISVCVLLQSAAWLLPSHQPYIIITAEICYLFHSDCQPQNIQFSTSSKALVVPFVIKINMNICLVCFIYYFAVRVILFGERLSNIINFSAMNFYFLRHYHKPESHLKRIEAIHFVSTRKYLCRLLNEKRNSFRFGPRESFRPNFSTLLAFFHFSTLQFRICNEWQFGAATALMSSCCGISGGSIKRAGSGIRLLRRRH